MKKSALYTSILFIKFFIWLFFVCKKRKICYNKLMGNYIKGEQNKNKMGISALEPLTDAKISGLTFSLAAILPVLLSFVFLLILAFSGVASQENYTEKDWYIYASYLLPQLAMAIIIFLYFRAKKTTIKAEVKAQNCHWKYYVLAIALQFGLFSLSSLNNLFLEFLKNFGYQDTSLLLPSMEGFGLIGVLLVVAVLPAIFEEMIFRGLLFKGLKSFGSVGAVLLCGGLFALYHQNPAQTIYQFCCGVAFALVVLRAGSIFPTMLSHFLNNALILILTKFEITEFPLPTTIVMICLSAVCLIASLTYLIFSKNTGKAPTDKKEKKTFFVFAALGIFVSILTWLFVFATGIVS